MKCRKCDTDLSVPDNLSQVQLCGPTSKRGLWQPSCFSLFLRWMIQVHPEDLAGSDEILGSRAVEWIGESQ